MAKVYFPSRCAVAVVCGEHLLTQVYPAAVPIAVFMDSIVELVNGDLKRRGVTAIDIGMCYELQRVNGTRLDSTKTLDELGIEDGSTLMLAPVERGDSFEPQYESLSTGLARVGKRLFTPVTAQTAVHTSLALIGMIAAAILGLAVYTRAQTDSLSPSIVTMATGLLLLVGAFSVWRRSPERHDLLTGFVWPAVPLVAVGFAAAAPGTLDVSCAPWCRIFIDGRDVGQVSPLVGYSLAAGKHSLRVEHTPSGHSADKEVVIEAGKGSKETINLR